MKCTAADYCQIALSPGLGMFRDLHGSRIWHSTLFLMGVFIKSFLIDCMPVLVHRFNFFFRELVLVGGRSP